MPFIGIVEKYSLSLDVLARLLRPVFPDIQLRSYRLNANAERANMLSERLAQTKAELGHELFEELLNRNNDELQLYEYLSRRLDLQATPANEATLIPKM
jgi:predicted DNA-binding protein